MIVIFRKNLRIIILFLSIALVTANKVSPPPRSVNVALETSFLFDPKDLHQNRYFVSNIREFLDKVLRVIDPQKPRHNFRAQGERRDTKVKLEDRLESKENKTGTSITNVLDFVKNVGKTFVNLTGSKIAEAVNNMHVEVITESSKIKYKGPTVIPEETTHGKDGKDEIKEIITDSINNWMIRYPEEMRTIMNTTVNTSNPLIRSFARRMNNYYDEEDMKKLKKLIKKFKRYIENRQDTAGVVSELLQNAIFKKYSNLNDTTKFALIEDLKMFSDFLIANNVFDGLNEHVASINRRSFSNPNLETDEFSNIEDISYTNLRRSIDNKLKNTRAKNKKRDSNEIIFDSAEYLARNSRKP